MKEELSKKTILHNKAQNKILDMLNNKEIIYQNVPIECSEKNAKLIKSFLYKEISKKYPKFNGYDKILKINQLENSELFKVFDKLPNLDEYSNMIENSIKNRKNNLIKNTYTEKSNITETSNTIETSNITETSNTIETNNLAKQNDNNVFEIINEIPLNLDNVSTNNNSIIVKNVLKLIRNVTIVYSFYKLFRWFHT